jgi:predicted dehydrogenase
MTTLVIGLGSIGKRHKRVQLSLGRKCVSLSLSTPLSAENFHDLGSALSLGPDLVIISNETDKHSQTLKELRSTGYKGRVLVEKPIADSLNGLLDEDNDVFVGYNLRFHPIVSRFRQDLGNEKIKLCSMNVGQYLPNWRPESDYKKTYSASSKRGGGVIRDLSHELDMLTWLCGDVAELSATSGNTGTLKISSEDHADIIFHHASGCHSNLHLNYLYRKPVRRYLFTTESHTYELDLVAGIYCVDSEAVKIRSERDDTYIALHKDIMEKQPGLTSTFKEAIQTLKLIEIVEKSSKDKKWIQIQ